MTMFHFLHYLVWLVNLSSGIVVVQTAGLLKSGEVFVVSRILQDPLNVRKSCTLAGWD